MDRGVIATATELFEARHYPGVVAMCSDALDDEPECVALLLVRARARIALRRDLDAQADLRDVIRLDPACGLAYRLLGELAARRDEHASAAVFLREALRLDPDDREAHDWLLIVAAPSRPAAEANQLPATAAAAGHFSSQPRAASPSAARLARGTQPPDTTDGEERPTRPFGRVTSTPPTPLARPTPTPQPLPPPPEIDRRKPSAGGGDPDGIAGGAGVLPRGIDRRKPSAPSVVGGDPDGIAGAAGVLPREREIERPTLAGRPPTQPPARSAPRLTGRGQAPELPGFGEYLVANGILTRERLRAAQAYQRSMRVQLATAIVTLGLATPQRIEWAAVAHQSQLSHRPL